jgi:lysophospholipid acyltransferase (LPLAT)-like uncharacterized protein
VSRTTTNLAETVTAVSDADVSPAPEATATRAPAAVVSRLDFLNPALTAPSRVSVWIVGFLATTYLRVRHGTWRKDDAELAALDQRINRGERLIIVCWHAKYVPLFTFLQSRGGCVFSSWSFRGRIIGEICRRLGYECVLLPHRRGVIARARMRDALRGKKLAALAVDGPAGPYHVMKIGVIEMASKLRFSFQPMSVASSPVRVYADRWDRMEVPRSFARVTVAVGDLIPVPEEIDAGQMEEIKTRVESALNALDARAEAKLEKKTEAPETAATKPPPKA